MPIFRLEDDKLVRAKETGIERERDIEDWLENSPWALAQDEFILWIGRQSSAQDEEGIIFPDLLGVDSEGNLVIIEFKRDRTPRTIIAQLLEYAAWANERSDVQIHEIAEIYFDAHEEYQEKAFDDVFRDVFDLPETDELPPLNQKIRLFIVAGKISPRITRVARFLRSSYGIDVICLEVSKFRTESGEEIVSMETRIGDEGFIAPDITGHRTPSSSRWSGDKPVREVVWEAVEKFTHGNIENVFTIKEILALIRESNPDFKRGTVDGTIIADTVNHPSRRYHSVTEDRYWRILKGKYRLYDPEKDKIHENDE